MKAIVNDACIGCGLCAGTCPPVSYTHLDVYKRQGWSYSTIQPDGYARWYRIGEDAAWTAMSVQVEGEGGFWVYNPEGYLTTSSVLWGDTKAPLEEGGLVVFAGDADSRFHLSFTR